MPRQPSHATLAPGLYLVATPIGNLGDITLRALDILRGADLIACEDTRVTRRLLSHYGVSTSTTAYHDHNAPTALPRLIKRLQRGEIVALVSDAGTPLISDPGYRLVQAAIGEDIPITTAPGPVAAIAALTLAGLPTDSFLFAGFLPPKQAARRQRLEALAAVPAALIFYESPRRVPATLAEMADCLGDRPAAVVREITKMFEEVRRGSLGELAAAFGQSGPPRGEVVLVVGPPAPQAIVDDAQIDAMLGQTLATMSLRDAVDHVAAASGRPRREVYRRALALSADEKAQ
ncbi:MAG: 16S rRNA (cytidine1402-2'-O)-methyltransferase [Alphaproteobacteria bacterium]